MDSETRQSRIVEFARTRGRVEVASRPGLTAFTVRLPRADADGPPYANRP